MLGSITDRNITLHRLARRLGETLISDGVIDEQQLRQGLERQQQTGAFLGETLVSLGFVDPNQLGKYLSSSMGFPFVDLAEEQIDFALARLIPEAVARKKLVIPFAEAAGAVKVALADPLNLSTVDELTTRLGKRVVPCLALATDIEEAIGRTFNVRHKAEIVLEDLVPIDSAAPTTTIEEDLEAAAEDAPIVRLVNSILEGAIAIGASDVHIEPNEHNVRVRYRIDGLLHEQMVLPRPHLAATVSRLKVMASMDIAERRRPQDGRFTIQPEGCAAYDLRVSIMPTVFGEKVVMRILQKSNNWATLPNLGFFPEQLDAFERSIKRPHGIILVTGPTGSGKSTTLYAALQCINDPALNINTIEDPVEYRLPGINHVQVNPKIGVTFAGGLRTLVRQDPDVIMVGEIRDTETAEIAIQAALTGHLVLSTLHTNDAPGSLVRLQNMGVEPFLVSSAIIGVVGQRLIRGVCPSCKIQYQASDEIIEAFNLPMVNGERPVLSKGTGCRKCAGRGLKGRSAVYEIMPMSESLRQMVLRRASGAELKEKAIEEGMITMRQSGIRKMLEGKTTPEEVTRVLFVEE